MANKILRGDTVLVMRGKEKGKTATVLRVLRKENKVLLKDVNLVKKHLKAIPNVREGGVYEIEAPIDISNVMLVCPSCKKPTRVGFKIIEEGQEKVKVRFCKKCNEVIDKVKRLR
ncbi:MAG: 50S ribosomal protein L24 [Aquificaceae bacterium]|nr:50S ribosomal protein L24 [Aquificaceae bacterium]